MMSEFGQQLIAETRKVAEANPEFVFLDACYYVNNGKPACLIGHALWNLGLINGALPVTGANAMGVFGILEHLGLSEVTTHEKTWLSHTQRAQDQGHPWGEAVAIADEEAGLDYEMD